MREHWCLARAVVQFKQYPVKDSVTFEIFMMPDRSVGHELTASGVPASWGAIDQAELSRGRDHVVWTRPLSSRRSYSTLRHFDFDWHAFSGLIFIIVCASMSPMSLWPPRFTQTRWKRQQICRPEKRGLQWRERTLIVLQPDSSHADSSQGLDAFDDEAMLIDLHHGEAPGLCLLSSSHECPSTNAVMMLHCVSRPSNPGKPWFQPRTFRLLCR